LEDVPGPIISVLTLLRVGALAVWFLGAKGFCTYGCPYGAVFGIAEKTSPIRIRVTDACEGCGHCTAVCTSNVRVHEEVNLFKMVVDSGCMKCLDCVSVCPKDALYLGAGPLPSPSVVRHVRPERRWDYTWPEEIGLALLSSRRSGRGAASTTPIPFLFALGIGTTFAWLATTAWRIARGRAGAWNGWRLNAADGSPSRAGRNFVLVAVAASALTAHAAFLQWNLRDGLALKAQVVGAPAAAHEVPAWKADHRSATEILGRVAAWSLAPDPKLDVDRADLALVGGDLAGAEALFRKAADAGEDTPYVKARLGDVEAARGKPDAADAAYASALAAGSGDLALWTKRADIAMSRGDTKAAAAHLENFVKGNARGDADPRRARHALRNARRQGGGRRPPRRDPRRRSRPAHK
jgi:ferredoxin